MFALNSDRVASSLHASARVVEVPTLAHTSHLSPAEHYGRRIVQNARWQACTSVRLQASLEPARSASHEDESAVPLRLPTVQVVLSSGDDQEWRDQPSRPHRTAGLQRTPLSGGVKNATLRYDLPPPTVAVRNLVEQAHFAHLCTVMSGMHHRRSGYPFGTLVEFASDGAGFPIFCLSPLAIHTRNLMEDPRCSLVVQMPGWTDLANARVTIFGDVYQLPADMQDAAREVYLQKHATGEKDRWVSGNYIFFRMHRISDIYFVGGFGTVQWVDVAEYGAVVPDQVATVAPHKTLQVLNDTFAEEMKRVFSQPDRHVDECAFISIDRLGTDVRVRVGSEYSVERLSFNMQVHTLEEAVSATQQRLKGLDRYTQKQ